MIKKKLESKNKDPHSIKTPNTNETMKPSVSFADEIIKVLDVKNTSLDNKLFKNRFRNKWEFDQEPYFNSKNSSLDDSLNEALTEDVKKFDPKCEMRIYKTEKPFFLRPCVSFRIMSKSENDCSKIRIGKRGRKKSEVESPVAKYIYGKENKSIIKNSSMENLMQTNALLEPERYSNKIMIKPVDTLKSEKNSANINRNQEFLHRNLSDFSKHDEKRNINRRRISKIPIRQGSSLERRPVILAERNKVLNNIKFDFNGKNYEEIFENMRKNDRENRLDYLLNLTTRKKKDSRIRKELKIFVGFVTILILLLASNFIFSVNLFLF